MNTILVPIDFSRVTRFVLAEAVKLARFSESRLVLLHVVQPPTVISDYGPVLENMIRYSAEAEKDAARHLARLQTKLRAGGIVADTILKTGIPLVHILEQAKKRKVSHIVIGSHGQTAFFDLIVGSTTHGVLKRSERPVLVVPLPAGEKSLARKKATP
jgi:nucleotide-binding universal stress UspA family protein